jgi:hypothetical protein
MRSAADSTNQSPDFFPDFLSKKHNEARRVASQEVVFGFNGKVRSCVHAAILWKLLWKRWSQKSR